MLPKDRAALELRLATRFEALRGLCRESIHLTNEHSYGGAFKHCSKCSDTGMVTKITYDTMIPLIVSMGWSVEITPREVEIRQRGVYTILQSKDGDLFVALMMAFDQATAGMEVANAPQ